MPGASCRNPFFNGLEQLRIFPGDTVLVHSSLKSLGSVKGGAEAVIATLLDYLTPGGTLLMPALSYLLVTSSNPEFDLLKTGSNVGRIAETFRKMPGVTRSVHPTHSVCGTGPNTTGLLEDHYLDRTPCGPNSPFAKLRHFNGKILMLGCGLSPNTMMHAVEEIVAPEYLFGGQMDYTITGEDGGTRTATYTRHGFAGWKQRYDRVYGMRTRGWLFEAPILGAICQSIRSENLWTHALERLRRDSLSFVERIG
jgi:aminoglycoside 3-N-acetyltransferase